MFRKSIYLNSDLEKAMDKDGSLDFLHMFRVSRSLSLCRKCNEKGESE